MIDPNTTLILATTALAGLAMLTGGMLAGWRGWLALKRQQMTLASDQARPIEAPAGQRIELADLKERIRKLEAIAAGVDL